MCFAECKPSVFGETKEQEVKKQAHSTQWAVKSRLVQKATQRTLYLSGFPDKQNQDDVCVSLCLRVCIIYSIIYIIFIEQIYIIFVFILNHIYFKKLAHSVRETHKSKIFRVSQ